MKVGAQRQSEEKCYGAKWKETKRGENIMKGGALETRGKGTVQCSATETRGKETDIREVNSGEGKGANSPSN